MSNDILSDVFGNFMQEKLEIAFFSYGTIRFHEAEEGRKRHTHKLRGAIKHRDLFWLIHGKRRRLRLEVMT